MFERLQNAISALNHVSCEGMQNLLNLGGSIGVLNEISQSLMQRLSKEKDNN